ncbi:MAG: hypothetical protein K6E97_06595, partial [Treponema sp.]|nr:hypothetical protein [Treponema sp.]
VWFFSNRIKKVEKNKIGIIYAFQVENSVQEKHLKSSFYNEVTNITSAINNSEIQSIFLSDYHARQIRDNKKYAEKLINKTKANIILYGKIEQRKSNNEDIYNISFNTIVRHNSVPIYISDAIANEMRSVLPRSINFAIKNEFNCFRYSSNQIGFAINFIIGIAYYYSKRYLDSYKIHYSCYNITSQRLQHEKNDQIIIRTNTRSRIYLIREATLLADIELKNGNYLESEKYINFALSLEKNNYDALLVKSIVSFLLGKIDESLQVLNQCQTNTNDYTWLYNKAFIYTYKEQFDTALKIYHSLITKSAVIDAANQCEVFIINYVDENPSAYRLYYALGMIYYKIKNDLVLAEQAFCMFVKLSRENKKYASTVVKVERIIESCQKKLSFN